jgi:hypothetical protein
MVNRYSQLEVQILLLRQKMTQQRLVIQQTLTRQQDTSQFPRSLGIKLIQRHMSTVFPWLIILRNKLQGKEPPLLWSVALTLGQHWLQNRIKRLNDEP